MCQQSAQRRKVERPKKFLPCDSLTASAFSHNVNGENLRKLWVMVVTEAAVATEAKNGEDFSVHVFSSSAEFPKSDWFWNLIDIEQFEIRGIKKKISNNKIVKDKGR
ncbi:hypothetical protein HAX54_005887, partial [Datura stramonium]|nr:hypothetical protein [Datura stramonium]